MHAMTSVRAYARSATAGVPCSRSPSSIRPWRSSASSTADAITKPSLPKPNTNKADAMSNETWDREAFKASIPTAREKVGFAARSIKVGPSERGWESHRPVIELIFHLCKLDYDIKVLLFQFF